MTRVRTRTISAGDVVELNNHNSSFEVQKRKAGYHGTLSKTKTCMTCSFAKFVRSANGPIATSGHTCIKCPFPIGPYGVCRNWQNKSATMEKTANNSDDPLGINGILDGIAEL